jgi:hypothetical protein
MRRRRDQADTGRQHRGSAQHEHRSCPTVRMQQGSAPKDDRTQRQEDEAHHDRDPPWCRRAGRQRRPEVRPSGRNCLGATVRGHVCGHSPPVLPIRRDKTLAEHTTPDRVIGPGPSRRAAPIGRDPRHHGERCFPRSVLRRRTRVSGTSTPAACRRRGASLERGRAPGGDHVSEHAAAAGDRPPRGPR